jgi:hypothetical protein
VAYSRLGEVKAADQILYFDGSYRIPKPLFLVSILNWSDFR